MVRAGTAGCTTTTFGTSTHIATPASISRASCVVSPEAGGWKTWLEAGETSIVCPSGRARETASMPIVPPPPGRFSTPKGWRVGVSRASSDQPESFGWVKMLTKTTS